jgi:two-component system, NtrC family, response regulator HydG
VSSVAYLSTRPREALIHPAVHKAEMEAPAGTFRTHARFGKLLGGSEAMQRLYDRIELAAPGTKSVLIAGEEGSGKDLVAHALHALGRRRGELLVPVKCAAVSPQLLELELFGRAEDGIAAASYDHRGFLERAHHGTLLLDEITEIPIGLQGRLLRVLESGTLCRVGSDRPVRTDVRILAATRRDPEEAVAQGKLRGDLHYRLQDRRLQLPPLRARDGDVVLLATYFLHLINVAESARKAFSPDALERLKAHHWPGNVRELKTVVQRAWILADAVIDSHCLPFETSGKTTIPAAWLQVQVGTSLADMERRLILATLTQCGGAKDETAALLGISVKTLYNRLHEYGVVPPPDPISPEPCR